jgi:hypothetical protein
MNKDSSIILFDQKEVRHHWNDESEFRYFSVINVISMLTDSVNSQAYWRKLKQRLTVKGNETVTSCCVLKMRAIDGKMRNTDVVDTENLLRLIQSIPSPKAESFKLWLAKVGHIKKEIGYSWISETKKIIAN